MKPDLEHLKRLQDDCVSIQKSLATIQSAQRVLSLYTTDERNKLLREYQVIKLNIRNPGGKINQAFDALMIFRQDHADLAAIGDVMEQLDSVNLQKLNLRT